MPNTFKGEIALDIRESTPDWDPYLAPQARTGAPNVLVRVGRRRLRHDGRVRRTGRDAGFRPSALQGFGDPITLYKVRR
jgi:hypothetical protein